MEFCQGRAAQLQPLGHSRLRRLLKFKVDWSRHHAPTVAENRRRFPKLARGFGVKGYGNGRRDGVEGDRVEPYGSGAVQHRSVSYATRIRAYIEDDRDL